MINNCQMISSVSILVATLIVINHFAYSDQSKTKSDKYSGDNILRVYNKGNERLKMIPLNRYGSDDELLRDIGISELPFKYQFTHVSKGPYLDTMGGGSIGFARKRSLDAMSGLTFGSPAKRNFDEIDNAGFGGFVKKNFDEIDRSGFNGFVKRNFDEIDRSGFGGFVRKRRGVNY